MQSAKSKSHLRSGFYILIVILFIFLFSCAISVPYNRYDPYKNRDVGLTEKDKEEILSGKATLNQLKTLEDSFYNWQNSIKGPAVSGNQIARKGLVMPATGKLNFSISGLSGSVTGRIFLKIGDGDNNSIIDPLLSGAEYTTAVSINEETGIEFYYSDISAETIIYPGDKKCEWEQTADLEWEYRFDINSDGDFSDCIMEVSVITVETGFIDLSDKLDVTVNYLGHHGYTDEGYVLYYIGETMWYDIKIKALVPDYLLSSRTYLVYVIHEYFEDGTCDRVWYPSPPRPEDEPQEITYKKGDPLPNQASPQKFEDVGIDNSETVLKASYTSTLENASGNDQTHVYIVRENEDGKIELKIYDNPECGVFDPPQ